MARSAARLRFVIFGSASLLLTIGLGAFGIMAARDRLATPEWTEYLGHSERASLESNLQPMLESAEDDPALRIPGLTVHPGDYMRNTDGDMSVFPVHLAGKTDRRSALRRAHDHWKTMLSEVELQPDGEGLVAQAENGDAYIARPNFKLHDEVLPLTIWRVRKFNQSNFKSTSHNYPWPEEWGNLFPPVPVGSDAVELGRPGFPGYNLMLSVSTPPEVAFKTLDSDLKRRGWKTFAGRIPGQEEGSALRRGTGLYQGVYRHEEAPLACQLTVDREGGALSRSQVLYALF